MKPIVAYELIDHGIEHSQYFQGCGVVFTPFDFVVTGIGDDFREAVEECLEQLAMMDYETEGMESRIERDYLDGQPLGEVRSPSVSEELEADAEYSGALCDAWDGIDCELWYHVSIRVY